MLTFRGCLSAARAEGGAGAAGVRNAALRWGAGERGATRSEGPCSEILLNSDGGGNGNLKREEKGSCRGRKVCSGKVQLRAEPGWRQRPMRERGGAGRGAAGA